MHCNFGVAGCVLSVWISLSFSIMQKMIIADTGWTTMQVSLGYCLMMTIYAITAFSALSGG